MNRLPDIKSMDEIELIDFISSIGEKKFRAEQIYGWLHNKLVNSFEEMKNLSNTLKEKLRENAYIPNIEILDIKKSNDGTEKYLFELEDGQAIETVLMTYKHGNSVCISSQAGCRMGCKFCASGINGLVRNLTPAEMLEQIYAVERASELPVSNIVVMGTGEPFDNYENLIKFIRIINSKNGKNIGQRNITVSTCGIVPKIYDFADLHLGVNLAISLHAPNDEIRQSLMPIVNKYTYEELMGACDYYIKKTNRRITFEYSLIKGVNDSKDDAYILAGKLKGMLCHVNLIPMNKVDEKPYEKSEDKSIKLFKDVLDSKKITTTIRRSLGDDVDAACGQLRKTYSSRKS